MSDAIVSHVASQEYRDHIDDMTCAQPGCKRWCVDGKTSYCAEHEWEERARASNIVNNRALLKHGIGEFPNRSRIHGSLGT